ncbi:MAG TPA: 16S rRNA (guanine(966)-N(2))-methyltransferase RsmD [Myxococcota bacterium]|nr:16S rRNA (guanine(966)-N(2))-methyltransferase RsmD [Myxococcota bacterium]
MTGGTLAGRRLRAPRGAAVRPTSDRVRESVFARLPELAGARVLDLFAGTGALGIEALSRGAAEAVFVERAGPALACLEANLASLGLAERSRVLRGAVHGALARLARERARFDLVLVDPPYGAADTGPALRALADAGLLAPGGTLVFETSRRHPPERVPGLVIADERRYGDTVVARYACADAPGGAAGAQNAGAAGREDGA